jgi:glutathione S-transferase
MSAIRLHYNPFSSSARRVTLLVHHLGLPVELALVENLRDPATRERIRAINPNLKIPVLEHGDFVLWESNAILQYLSDLTPGQTVWPADPRARADVSRWLFWGTQHWGPPIGALTWERWMKGLFGAGEPDRARIEAAERDLEVVMALLGAQLTGRRWVTGDTLTLADLSLSPPLMRAREASIDLDRWPSVRDWLGRIQELPAWQATQPDGARRAAGS